MSIPIIQNGSEKLAGELYNALRHAYAACIQAQSDNNNDVYGSVITIPSSNKYLQDIVSSVQGSGNVSRVVAKLNDLLPSDTTITDVQNFASAFNSLANDIETNANLFIMSINPTSKNPEYVTPVSAGVKSIIDTRISAVLAEVS